MRFASMTSRLLAIWLLELWPEDGVEWEECVEEGVVLRDMRTAVDESRQNLLKESRKDRFGMAVYENLEVSR